MKLPKFKALTYASFIPILMGILGIHTYNKKTNDFNNGSEEFVKIIEKPFNCKSINSRSTFIKIEYNGLIIPKKIGARFCRYLDEDKVKMKIAPDKKDLFFLYEIDDFPDQIGASTMLSFMGVIIFFISLRKETEKENF